MRFLCERHRACIASDVKRAGELWDGAFLHGDMEYQAENWALAKAFFGSAFEIALLLIDRHGDRLSQRWYERLFQSGSYLACVYCQMEDYETAEYCLAAIQKVMAKFQRRPDVPGDCYQAQLILEKKLSDILRTKTAQPIGEAIERRMASLKFRFSPPLVH